MNALLWVLQILLAVVFAAAGSVKLLRPRAQLVGMLGGWVEDFPAPLLRPLGLVEVLAAVGLLLPPLFEALPVLTPLAAWGLVVLMLGAVVLHARRSEYSNAAVNLVLAAMAVTVAWLRFGPYGF
jgi:uncharacterized membrane protein YphA (DoxX/SURF4 family)